MFTMLLILCALMCLGMFAFDFEPTLDKLDEVPDKFKPFYTKGNDGKFTLDSDLGKKVDNTGLVSALEKERKTRKELDKAIAGWKALGDTPDEIKAKLDALEIDDGSEDADKKKAKKDAMAKLKVESETAQAKIKNEYEGKITKMEQSLKKQMIDSEATMAIAELKGVPELLLPHIREKCLLVVEGDAHYVRVVDAEGDPRGNGKGGFLTVRELVAEMRQSDVYGRAFEAEGTQGSGMRPSNGNGGGGSAPKNSVQKISAGLSQRRS